MVSAKGQELLHRGTQGCTGKSCDLHEMGLSPRKAIIEIFVKKVMKKGQPLSTCCGDKGLVQQTDRKSGAFKTYMLNRFFRHTLKHLSNAALSCVPLNPRSKVHPTCDSSLVIAARCKGLVGVRLQACFAPPHLGPIPWRSTVLLFQLRCRAMRMLQGDTAKRWSGRADGSSFLT